MVQDVNDPTGLSLLYHLNSEPWVNEAGTSYGGFHQKAKSYPNAPRTPLPSTDLSATDQIAQTRRSTRAFADVPLPLSHLAGVLRSGYQAIGPDPLDSDQHMLRRPVPSAGGLYPLEIYVLIRNVQSVLPGVYHYDPVGDALEGLGNPAWEGAAPAAFLTWPFVQHAPAIICIGAVFERCQAKYGPRGYRYVLLEAGHVGQNMCLRAGDDGLETLFLGGFQDSILNGMVGLDGTQEAIVYTMALGQGAGTP